MSSKKCISCGLVLEIESFYKHGGMKDGRLNKCMECVKKSVRDNRIAKIDHYRAFDKARASMPHRVSARETYLATPRGIAAASRAKKAWMLRNAEKRHAHNALANAVSKGEINRLPCFVCGREDAEAHHPDYSAPLIVTWLCSTHHAQLHKEAREMLRAA